MAAITPSLVKELRDRTGLGMMECKKALKGAEGDIETAIDNLRKDSGLKAAKKSGRTAAEGIAVVKVADDNKSAVIVEINSETDFAAREANFLGFANLIAEKAFEAKQSDVAVLMAGVLEKAREELVQKIGENISVRRIEFVEGDVVSAYTHGAKIAAVTVLTGGTPDLAKDISMHIAASNPQFLSPDEISEEVLEREKDVIRAQSEGSGKPAEIIEKMMVGRIKKFQAEISLTEQAFVKDPDVKVGQLAKKADAVIQSFVRFEVGEGIEVEEVDFAAEVAAAVQGV